MPEQTAAVLVLTDDALNHPAVRQLLAVQWAAGDWREELVLVSAADLGGTLPPGRGREPWEQSAGRARVVMAAIILDSMEEPR